MVIAACVSRSLGGMLAAVRRCSEAVVYFSALSRNKRYGAVQRVQISSSQEDSQETSYGIPRDATQDGDREGF